MDDTAALIQRLYDEASQCELFGITKPAALLREAAEALQHAANMQAIDEFSEVVTAGHLSEASHPPLPPDKPVAWGYPNSAITGRNRWMMLREEVPSDDQYSGAMWAPLYTAPKQAEPLRLDQIAALEAGCGHAAVDWDTRVSLVRAVERVHGIGA
jgi:hypothetical protein